MSEQDKKAGPEGGEASGEVGQGQDPKNVAELTNYIQSMLQQMQDRSGHIYHKIKSKLNFQKETLDNNEDLVCLN